MSINNIEEYLIERLLDLDPTLSSSQGSLMFTKVITPLVSRLGADPISIDMEAFITQRLRDEFPELDVASPGSSLRDIIVSPLVVLLEPIRREVEFLRTQQTLANQAALSEDEMDAILANVFSERMLGDFSRGTVRVFFTAPYPAGIDATTTFSTRDGKSFVPEVNTTVSLAEFERSGNQYFLDIDVRSTVASEDHNVGVADIVSVIGLQNVSRVTNLRSFSGGVTRETNEEYLERAERSLSERSLNTKRGIETELLNSFSDLVSIDVVGFGESAMQRDVLQGEVTFDLSETTGPMSFMTSDWMTHDVLNSGASRLFPFTNTIVLKEPLSGWTEKTENRIKNAKFMRLADGSGDVYDHRLLGRVRTVSEVYKHPGTGAYYIKTNDFEVYPSPASIAATTAPTTLSNVVLAAKQGLNMEATQGSAFRMFAEVDGTEVITGSYLPFTDVLETAFTATEVPGSVIKGRDFLVVADASSISENADGPFGYSVSKKIRTYPLTRFFTSTKLGVGRVDSFLLSRDRYLYRGSDEFVFDTSLTYSALNEGPKVLDFGAPKYTSDTVADRFGGIEAEKGGRSPGVTIEGKLPGALGLGSVPDPDAGDLINAAGAGLLEADLILDRSNTPWDERGAQIGQFISCSLFSDTAFTGSLAETEAALLWQGVGVVDKVGYGDRWRLRVKGLDWTMLEEGVAGFAPSASATITVLNTTEVGNAVSTTRTNPEGEFVFKLHTAIEGDSYLNIAAMVDHEGDAVPPFAMLGASVLDRWGGGDVPLEPSSEIDSRSTVTITMDNAVYDADPVAEDFRLAVKNSVSGDVIMSTVVIPFGDVPDANTFATIVEDSVIASAIVGKDPNSSNRLLLDTNRDSLVGNESALDPAGNSIVLKSLVYGNYPSDYNWEVVFIKAATTDELTISGLTIGAFSTVENRSVEALTAQLIRQANFFETTGDPLFPFTAALDGDLTDALRISHTTPGTAGNGGSVTAVGTALSVSQWNVSYSNINGGFSSGFGPMRQVRGIENPIAPLYGTLAANGYEELTVTPDVGTATTYYSSTENRNLAYQRHASDPLTNVRVVVEITDGADELRIVLDDNSEGALIHNPVLSVDNGNYPMDAFSGTVTYASGDISIITTMDEALPSGETKFFTAYSYFENAYKVAWTLYRGALEVIDSSGNASKSYDELAFAPATRTGNRTYSSGPSAYDGKEFESHVTGHGDFTDTTSTGGYGTYGAHRAYWIRLGKSFEKLHPSIGTPPTQQVKSAEFTRTDFPPRGSNNWQPQYYTARFDGETTVSTKISAPLFEGSMGIVEDASGVVSHDPETQAINNAKGLSGFLIPLPMGTSTYDAYGPGSAVTVGDVLEHQVVQLFEAAPSDFGDTKISISGIPGGVPLPGFTAVDLEVESDKIHIGGLTDIYLKPSASSTETTSVINLSPSSPSAEDGDVVLQASDGIVNPTINASHFFSSELESELTNLFGAAPAFADNLVLEIVEPPSLELSPTFVRILHSVPGGCRIDGSFPDGLGDGFENLRFRVLRTSSTSLVQPLSILQQGEDLAITQNSNVVQFAGGINFTTDPSNRPMYLYIDSETGSGEYEIVSRNLNTLELRKVVDESESGLSYRIYIKQAGGISLPLVRVNEVSLSGDSEGVKVPYSEIVDAVASSFSGLNDDPITEDIIGSDGGELTKTFVTVDGELVERCTFTVPGLDFREYGAIRYDVLVLAELDEPLRHWYVDDIQMDLMGDYSILVLDRSEDVTSDSIDIPFTLGKPSIGTASIKLLDPTYLSVGPSTVFCYEDPSTGKKNFLRPSPAETSCVFKSYDNVTDVSITQTDNKQLVSTGNFFRHGVSVGDKVRIVTKVLMSDEFDGSPLAMEHENINVAGKTLAVKINNTLRTVTFSGPNPLTIESVVNDINQQLGYQLRASVHSENRDDDGDGTDETYYRVMISSSNDVEIVSQGTIGIVEELRLSTDLDNTPPGDVLIGDYKITDIGYIDEASASDGVMRTTLTLDEPIPLATTLPVGGTRGVFIEILRERHQSAFPSELEQDASGLYTANIKLTSYEPNTTDGIVPEDGQLTVDGYTSLGYHLKVENNNYSYSVGEKVEIVCSSVTLHSSARSMKDAYELAAADVTVTYDTAPTVDSVQSYVLSPTVRVLCNNPLVRHYFPAYPIMSVSYAGAMSEQAVSDNIKNLLSSLYPNLPLEVYALSSMLSKLGVTYLENPQEVGFIVHDADRKISIVRSKNRVALNKQTHLMEDMSRVTISRVG